MTRCSQWSRALSVCSHDTWNPQSSNDTLSLIYQISQTSTLTAINRATYRVKYRTVSTEEFKSKRDLRCNAASIRSFATAGHINPRKPFPILLVAVVQTGRQASLATSERRPAPLSSALVCAAHKPSFPYLSFLHHTPPLVTNNVVQSPPPKCGCQSHGCNS